MQKAVITGTRVPVLIYVSGLTKVGVRLCVAPATSVLFRGCCVAALLCFCCGARGSDSSARSRAEAALHGIPVQHSKSVAVGASGK